MEFIKQLERIVGPYLTLIIFIGSVLVASLLGLIIFFKVLSYFQKRRDSYVLFIILGRLKRPFYFLIPALSLGIFTPLLNFVGHARIVPDLIQAWIIFTFTWLLLELIWVFEASFDRASKHKLESSRRRVLKTQIRFLSRFLVIVVLVIMAAVFVGHEPVEVAVEFGAQSFLLRGVSDPHRVSIAESRTCFNFPCSSESNGRLRSECDIGA